MSASTDIKRGREAIVYFHNEALRYSGGNRTLEQTIDEIEKRNPAFLDGFGFALSASGANEAAIQAAMEGLAREGQGRIPARWQAFFDAVQGKAGEVSFFDAFVYTAEETAKDIGAGVQSAGNATIEGLKSAEGLIKYLPYIAVAAALGYVFISAGGLRRGTSAA